MRESNFGKKIKAKLPRTLHWQSNVGTQAGTNGTPDKYVDGPGSDLWIELKQFDSMPRGGTVCVAPIPLKKKQPRGHLTVLQLTWLCRRWDNGHNAVVIAGLPNGKGLLMLDPEDWQSDVPVSQAKTVEEIARWITNFCSASLSRK